MNLFLGEWVEKFSTSAVILNIRRGKQCRQGTQQPHAISVISRVVMPVGKTASVLCKEGPYCYIAQTDNEASNEVMKHF